MTGHSAGRDSISSEPAQRPVVLVFIRHYLPGGKSGGPVRSVANLVEQLGDEFDFRIITADRDMLDPAPYGGVAIDGWNAVGKASVCYLSPGNRSMRAIVRLLRDVRYDVLYLNSFFDPDFTLRPLWARRLRLVADRPVIIAPRGEFSPGALGLKRRLKAVFMRVASVIGLYRGLTWQASTRHEADDIRRALGRAERVVVASDMSAPPPTDDSKPGVAARGRSDPLRIVFLSRITVKKNLDFALRVLAMVDASVQFDIYGPVEDEAYWRQCQGLISSVRSRVTVEYRGVLEHADVARVLAGYDLFFLPTRGENFGHVIMESLSVGTPVLLANTTPWRDLEAAGVGWDLPLDSEQAFAEKINVAATLSEDTFRVWRERVRSYARAKAIDPEVLLSNRTLFAQAVATPRFL